MWGFPDFNFDTFAKICKDATIELNNNNPWVRGRSHLEALALPLSSAALVFRVEQRF